MSDRRYVYSFLCVMLVLTVLGCAAVHKAVEDYNVGINSVPTVEISGASNAVADVVATLFPEFKTYTGGFAFAIASVITFLSGVLLGKRKKKG